MSLEQAIEANTAAIRELIAALKPGTVAAQTEAPALAAGLSLTKGMRQEMAESAKEPATKKPTLAPAANSVSSPNGASPQSDPAPAAQEPIVVDLMKDVVPVFSKLCVDKGRDAGAAILKKWNVTKLSLVPADKLVAVLEDIKAAA
jgi:hypothetical protein